MQKRNKRQKRSLIFSTTVVIAGCIATAIYVNQTMESASEYKVDLAQLNTEEKVSIANDPEFNEGASLARVSGSDVVNEQPKKDTSEEKDNELQPSFEEEKREQNSREQNTGEEVNSDSVLQNSEKLSFDPKEGMGWPLVGDVILNYSMDNAVYFATLEQYKYNPAILISAQQGSPVSSVAKGEVVKIGESAELGRYMVMDLGNDYEVTYGQLDQLQATEGDVIARGQVIGYVAKTTKYYSVEGDHVYLKITKNAEPVNPISFMD